MKAKLRKNNAAAQMLPKWELSTCGEVATMDVPGSGMTVVCIGKLGEAVAKASAELKITPNDFLRGMLRR